MNKIKIVRLNTLISYFALLIFLIADSLIHPPAVSTASLMALIAVKCVPLLLPVGGVVKGDVRAHSWLCFIVLVYFMSGVLRATTPNQLMWGLIEVFLSVEVFICAMLYVKWKKASV